MSYDPNEAKSIFFRALEITAPGERAAFLEQACIGKAELRARVASLLRTNAQADSLFDRQVGAEGATQLGAQEPPSVSLEFLEPSETPGSLGRVGDYEVLQVIGRGGMGIVLRAVDGKLNRVVAVKVLAPELANLPQARRRFLREAQAAAAVSHDHVVTIHAVDDGQTSRNKLPFLVMECIIGQSLQQKIDIVGSLQVKEILRIGMQIAFGLAGAHKQGLVHRDIKPANILLENGVERVKITDFGLARASDDVGITQTGQIAGTPQYMSPEQALGQPVDQRSDLFSLGSVLYTMCTGRPAFRADSAVAVLRRVCDETPRPIREVNAEIPSWLIDIVDRLLAKKPENRFQTANEVAVLLEHWLAHCQNPETVVKPQELGRAAPDADLTGRERTGKEAPSPNIPVGILRQAWNEWWGQRNRWIAMSIQTVLILVYLVCMICFVSMGASSGRDAEGHTKLDYRLGAPSPWFHSEVYPEPNMPFRTQFNLWSSSVLIGLMGCAAHAVFWRIELARNPKTSKWNGPAFMLGIWGVGAVIAMGFGMWQGYMALEKSRSVNAKTVMATSPSGTWPKRPAEQFVPYL